MSHLDGQTSSYSDVCLYSDENDVAAIHITSDERHALRYSDTSASEHNLLPQGARHPEIPYHGVFTVSLRNIISLLAADLFFRMALVPSFTGIVQEIMSPAATDTPLGTPSQGLLESSDPNGQFASYQPEAKDRPWNVPESTFVLLLCIMLSLNRMIFSNCCTRRQIRQRMDPFASPSFLLDTTCVIHGASGHRFRNRTAFQQ
jgi:hypothetical protein